MSLNLRELSEASVTALVRQTEARKPWQAACAPAVPSQDESGVQLGLGYGCGRGSCGFQRAQPVLSEGEHVFKMS